MRRIYSYLIPVFLLNIPLVGNAWEPNPCIDIEKHISVDNGITWADADTPDTAPAATLSQGAMYKLVISNCGEVPLTDVVINDGKLGIVDCTVGDLDVRAVITIEADQYDQLYQPERCHVVGEFENIADVSAQSLGGPVADSDPAWIKCISPPLHCIDIEKYISVDNGTTWADADTPDTAPTAPTGQGVLYKLVVSNCGEVPLTNVLINDSELGITDYSVEDLDAGATITIEEDQLGELYQPDRCDMAGDFQNIASVSAQSDCATVIDSDPAWIKCLYIPVPCIDIEKYISVNNGTTWADADTPDIAPTATIGQGALYKLVVSNCGNTLLTSVVINDGELGIVDYSVGDLDVGAVITIEEDQLDQLYQPDRCDMAGDFQNIANVTAQSEGETLADGDPAWVICFENETGNEGCSQGYWKNHHGSWAVTGYSPGDEYDVVFGVDDDTTLGNALRRGGGKEKALARKAVTALLNASHPGVHYYYSEAEVIAIVQDAFATRDFEGAKELLEEHNKNCPLN